MDPFSVYVLIAALIVCAYMAWNIGANDVANAMGTSVGSRALTLKQAVIIAAIFEFAGAFLAGDAVTDTVRKGILSVDFDTVNEDLATKLMFGFIAAMLAAALWLTVATRFGLPVSTTHSIIGGIVGIGLVIDSDMIDWGVVGTVVMSWIASPLMGAVFAFVSFMIIKKLIYEADNPVERSRWMAPLLAFPTFFVLGLALQFKALKGLINRLDRAEWINKSNWLPASEGGVWNPLAENAWFPMYSILLAIVIGTLASLALYSVLRKYDFFKGEGYQGVERVFVWLQIITAAYVAFAHGANDRSNAIGPMAAVYSVWQEQGVLLKEVGVPLWLVLIGSAGIAIGVITWGWRVMETIGRKITDITPTRGFAAEFGAATTILIFSMPFLAVPVSTTHTLVGAVVGVGLAGGASAVDFRVFGKIAASWVASLPAAGFGAIILYYLFGGSGLIVVLMIPVTIVIVAVVLWKTADREINVEEALVVSENPDVSAEERGVQPTPIEMFHRHAEAVEKTVKQMVEAVSIAAKGEDATEAIEETVRLELEADEIKNEIRNRLSGRVKLILGKEVFLYMLTRQDRIADYAQNVAEQLSFRELYSDEEARNNLVKMAESVLETVEKYEDAALKLKELCLSGYARVHKEELQELIKAVNLKEHQADEIEQKAAAHVFSTGDEDALAAMHMYRVLQRLDDVANAAEKAANAFLPIVSK